MAVPLSSNAKRLNRIMKTRITKAIPSLSFFVVLDVAVALIFQ